MRTLKCKHYFHPECIDNIIKTQKKCPICSQVIELGGNNYKDETIEEEKFDLKNQEFELKNQEFEVISG